MAVAVGVTQGAAHIPWGTMAAALAGEASPAWRDSTESLVLWHLRVPRVILALLVGAALSVSGAMMQGLFRNPLADPGLIGVASGAALGAVLVILLAGQPGVPAALAAPWALPVSALAGSWLATAAILRIGTSGGATSVATVLLAGIAVNAFAGAVIGFCTFLADDEQLRSLNFWMLGSLGRAEWKTVAMIAPFCLIPLAAMPWMARALNAFTLGEAEAGHLGFDTARLKTLVILLTAAAVGGCVAHTGMIGFVGLVVPHLFRITCGPDHRWLLPGSALLGGALLIVADTASRTLAAPAEIPIGVLTAAVGAPFFLALLLRRRLPLP